MMNPEPTRASVEGRVSLPYDNSRFHIEDDYGETIQVRFNEGGNIFLAYRQYSSAELVVADMSVEQFREEFVKAFFPEYRPERHL